MSGARVRTWLRRISAAAVVLAASVLFVPATRAAEATISPSPTGYYTATQDPLKVVGGQVGDVACQVPSPDPRTCLDPSQVTGGTPQNPRKDNYIYVATIAGNDDAQGVIGVPLFSVPLGATIRSLELEFQVENEPNQGTFNFDPDNPHLQFCLITEGWAGQDAAPYDSRPDSNCEVASLPKKVAEEERDETTEEGVPVTVTLVSYTVDLMPMVRAWADGTENNGVAVRTTPDVPFLFEAAIRTPAIAADGMVLRVTYDPPATAPGLPVAPVDPPPADAPSFAEPEEPTTATVPEPPFEVAETEGSDLAARPVARTSTPWWTYLALPLGLATLAGLGRGTAEPVRSLETARAGPVSRLMTRGGAS